MTIFDTHAHYHDIRFLENGTDVRDTLLNTLFGGDIIGIVNIGTDVQTSTEAIALAERYPNMYAAVGMYPSSCPLPHDENAMQSTLSAIEGMLAHSKVVAIGEIGYDFYYDTVPHEVQEMWFEAQMQLSEKTGYPIVIHNRDAHDATLSMLKKHPAVTGILHSYSGSAEMAKALVSMGYYISLSGVVTFKNARKACEVAKILPDDRILIETDAPYLTPVPHRGKMNHSGYLVHTLQTLAELRRTSVEHMAAITAENAKKVFRLP